MMLSIPIIRKPVERTTMRKSMPTEGMAIAITEKTTVRAPIPKSKALDNLECDLCITPCKIVVIPINIRPKETRLIITAEVNRGWIKANTPSDIAKIPNPTLTALADLLRYFPAMPIAILPEPSMNNAIAKILTTVNIARAGNNKIRTAAAIVIIPIPI